MGSKILSKKFRDRQTQHAQGRLQRPTLRDFSYLLSSQGRGRPAGRGAGLGVGAAGHVRNDL